MSRSSVPSRLQVSMLLECLEERRWLGTGHARTLHARDRVRAAWEEVAAKLNSDQTGCIKSWQQWSKYWKDKKASVKRKTIQIRMARQQTGGGAEEEGLVLSAIEERILALMRGAGLRKLKIDPEQRRLNQQSPPSQRQSLPASLTERLIAIEEKRLDNERLVIQNQQKMLDIFQSMSEAWTSQAQAMQDLCATVRRGT